MQTLEKTTVGTTERILREIVLFKNCNDGFFSVLAGNARSHKHEKGKILFIHGDDADTFYLIKSGWIKLFRETLDGAQAVVDIFTTGHIFGETAIFEDDVYPYSAEIVEPAEIISLPLSALKTEIENNNRLALDMLGSMARYRRQQDQEIEHRSFQNAAQRIGCFLLRLTSQKEEGATAIHLPYDKLLVASRLGMQPETFSRALAKLKEKTDIRIKGATIEIDDIEELSHYCCAACSSDFPCKDLQPSE